MAGSVAGWFRRQPVARKLTTTALATSGIALVPLALVEDVAMVGPLDKVREELDQKWRRTCMTTLLVNGTPDHLRVVADMVNG